MVTAQAIGVFGRVLTDSTGRALYMFPPDARQQVSCTGPCAGTWPPLTIATGAAPAAGSGVDRKLLGTLPDPNSGARIVTYDGFPLYRYAGDTEPGTANGQALFLDGGPWYLLAPSGTPLTAGPGGAQ
jgi:predicted lipoprotein with Yx(FWY)xxD motif